MATLSTISKTLSGWAKMIDPDGKIARIVELLNQSNEMLDDMTFMEGNLPMGHQITQRTQLPAVYYRLINAGVLPSTTSSAQIQEQVGMLEAYSQVDTKLASLNGNIKAFRLSEARPFVEAMNQRTQTTIMYGNSGVNPQEFTGFAPRYSLSTAGNGANIIKGGGSGSDNLSVWLVVWGPNTVSGIFPKGSRAGLHHTDEGEVLIQNAAGVTGALMKAIVDHWEWDMGIALMDWRYVVRICNVDVSDLLAQVAGTAADLRNLMIKAMWRIPNLKIGNPVFYMNRTAAEYLDIERVNSLQTGGGMTYETIDGKRKMTFRGVPIKIVDALLNTEATVA